MLDYKSVPHVFIILLYHFGMIYGTNLLTRCPMPVHVFCCLFVSEKLFGEVSRESSANLRELFSQRNKDGARRGAAGGPQPPGATQARPRCWPRRGSTWATPSPPRVALSPINCLRRGNPRYPIMFSRKHSRPPPSPTLDRQGSEALPGTLQEGEIVTGGIYTTMPASGVMRE